MAEMIIVKCDVGSKLATVLCPYCARISRQILKMTFNNDCNNELLTAHTCPACGTVYNACNSFGADVWKAAYSRYMLNPDSYNEAVKENYSRRKQRTQDELQAAETINQQNAAPTSKPQNVEDPVQKNVLQTEEGKEDALRSVALTLRSVAEKKAVQPVVEMHEPPKEDLLVSTNSKSTSETIINTHIQNGDAIHTLMERKIDRWKKDLLDTGKRNKMINYRETKRATLKILEPSATELFNQLAVNEKTLTFQRPISKDSDFRTYSMLALLETLSYSLPVHVGDIKAEGTVMEREKTLKNLRSKTKLAQEEQGINILYLSFGFIMWREHNRDSSPWLKSPLLMMPVQLGVKSLNAPYTLSKYDDEIEVNPTLDYLFNQDYGIDLPTFELRNKDSFENYLEQIEEIIDKKGWKLIREVSLGLLSFLKISMYHDLNNNRELMMNNSVIQAISGDRHALGELPAEANNFNFDKTQPMEWHEVVDSDSSQGEAILLSKLGVSFVMQGPPGTGKSQTITNIIAEALGDGKKVLFVSEKSAALQVVLKRLTEARLEDFCLSLHNYKANKKEIIDNIGANLSLSAGYVDSSVMGELTELFHDRKYLDEYADDLHKIIEPFGESVYMVFGRLARLQDATAIEYKIQNPTEVTKEEYASLLYLVNAFEKALNSIEGPLTDNPWADTAAMSSGQIFKAEMMKVTGGLAEALGELEGIIVLFNSDYNGEFTPSWNEVRDRISGYETVLALPLFPAEWRSQDRRVMLRSRAVSEQGKMTGAKTHVETIKGITEKIGSEWSVYELTVAKNDLDQLIKEKEYECDVESGESLAKRNKEIITFLKGTSDRIDAIYSDYRKAVALLNLTEGSSFSDVVTVIRIIKAMENAPVMDAAWFDVQKNPEYIEAVEEAARHQNAFAEKKAKVLEHWEKAVLDINVADLIIRFKTKYTAEFYKTKECIDADLDRFRIMHKSVGVDIDDSEIIDMLQALLDVNTEKKWFADNDSRIRNVFFSMYQGVDTDWVNTVITIQNLSDEAKNHQARIQELTNQVLSRWEIGALNIDSSGMLNRFKTEYVGILRRMKASYKEDMKQIRLLSKSVGVQIEENEVIALLQTLNEIRQEKQWFLRNAERFKSYIPTYCRAEDTDWDRVIREVRAIAEEARGHQTIIREKSAKILNRWDQCVFETEPVEILRRFREEYTESYRTTNDLYKKDIAYLMGLSKHVGEKVSSSVAIDLLRVVNEINMEKEWYKKNDDRLSGTFKSNYAGLDTNWGRVMAGIRVATDVASLIPGISIPEDIIRAIHAIIESTDKMAQMRNLTESLTEEKVMNCAEEIGKAINTAEVCMHVSIQETILPGIRNRVEHEEKLRQIIRTLDAAKKAGNTYYSDLKGLAEEIDTVLQENAWFINNTSQFENVPNVNSGDGSVHSFMEFASIILRRFAGETTYVMSEELKNAFGERYTGLDTDWQLIIRDIDSVSSFEECGVPKDLDGFIEAVSDDAEKRIKVAELIKRIRELMDTNEEGFKYFDELFPASNMKEITFHEIVSKYDSCLSGFGELNKWLDFVETKKECDAKGLGDFTDKVVKRNNTVRDVRKAFERGFYMQWLSLAIDDVPSVQTFRRRAHEQRLERFMMLDERQFEFSKERIRDRIVRSFPSRNAVTSAKSELRILQHEMEKKRRIMPLRKLFHEIPALLLTLKPCLMMSPLSVAYFLNAEDYHFDMVIFDEASQIFPQDAIGAIFRADQVIIAGDTKQLPPTNFFSSSTSNGNDDYDDDNEDNFEDEVYDSILEETANVLPNRTLLWHYRSKHEHLIAFSNQEIYRNELVTFPSSNESEPDTGVELEFVEDGYYEGGGKNCNVLEAKRCVELVKNHIDKHPERSLGIITFSEKQQQAISLEIQRFREQNPKYEDFFVEDKEDAFFVKNLENVQGDERDAIFFSVGYARTKEQKATGKPMAMRFGPLGVSGGERRLNVAITRAKRNVKLVSSILPSDIDLSRTESDGIRMLRSYIEFAMNRGATLVSANQSRVPDDFANAIYKFICDKGYKARQCVGCSGYRIDIAVEHPKIEGEFVVGIECDGVSYVSAKTARDRDRLRGFVLRSMGWNLYRVWSTEWYRNPEFEGNRLIEFIDSAIGKSNERLKAIGEEKQAAERRSKAPNEGGIVSRTTRKKPDGSDGQMSLEDYLGIRSKGGLYDELVSSGFTCIDNRLSSSIIWVLYQLEEEEKFESIAAKYHVQYKLEKRGEMVTGGKAAWRIMA